MTLGGAVAASFPAPFYGTSSCTVVVVYGANAAAGDFDGDTSISDYLATKVTVTGGTPSGESALLDKSTDHLNFGENVTLAHSARVNDGDLPVLLADGTYSASDNDEFNFEQTIDLGVDLRLTYFRDSEYEDLVGLATNTPAVGIKIADGLEVLNYTLDFSDVESDIVSSELEDVEGSTITLLGKAYYVSDFDTTGGSSGYLGKLTLLDAANTGIVNEDETTTLIAGGTSYEVSIQSLTAGTSAEARLVINGETTSTLEKGESQKLKDGSYVGIK